MATNGVNRGGVVLPPSLPTIKETTLSWLGSELDSSIFSTNGRQTDNDPAARQLLTKNVQRHIDFDEQCLSLKSEEESEFSGIQPLPVGSDDTPPMACNDFNRVVKMDFGSVLSQSQNRPRPMIESDDEEEDGTCVEDTTAATHVGQSKNNIGLKPVTPSDFQALIGMLDTKSIGEESAMNSDDAAMEKLRVIRLLQLMQQEDLRRRQEAEIAVLNAQREKMKLDRSKSSGRIGLEKLDSDLGIDSQDLGDSECGEMQLNMWDGNQHGSHRPEVAVDSTSGENSERDLEIPVQKNDFDEIPVGKGKSFEQLLEEAHQKEPNNQKDHEKSKSKGPVKKPFLRKGQGLARYKGPVQRPSKPKTQTRDKSLNQGLSSKGGGHSVSNKSGKVGVTSCNSDVRKPPSGGDHQKLSGQAAQQKLTQKVRMPISKLLLKQEIKSDQLQEKSISPCDSDMRQRFFRPAKDAALEEFEMLEHYAEENASLLDEPSLVVSILQHEDDPRDEKQLSLRDRVRERRRLREEARVKVQNCSKQSKTRSGSDGTHSDCNEKLKENLEDDSDHLETDEILSPSPPKPYFSSPEKQQNKVMQRKTASFIKKEKLMRPVVRSSVLSPSMKSSAFQSSRDYAGLQSSPYSAFSPHHSPVILKGTESVPPREEQLDNHTDAFNDFQDEETWGDVDVSVLNITSQNPNVQENKGDEHDSSKEYKCSDYMEPENEDAENPVRDTDPGQLSSSRGLSLSPPPPPTSLMQKLFPSLKVPKPSLPSSNRHLPKDMDKFKDMEDNADLPTETPQSEPQAIILKQKLEELENEISRFKKENSELEKLRQKQEVDARNLAKEVEEFRKQKDEEIARLEDYKKTEVKKLKKEKKLFEEHVLATKMMPRKEEREEIQKLQEEMERMRAENHSKEQKLMSANNRLRDQVIALQKQNEELQERFEELEKQRIKERKMQKSKCTRPPSVWETVNNIVSSTVMDAENENFSKTKACTTSSTEGGKNVNAPGRLKKVDLKKSKAPSPENPITNAKTVERTKLFESNSAETMHQDGKVERILKDGRRIVLFPNGTQKEISSDGKMVKVRFANGDIKEMYGDGSIVYYYDENGTTHTTHSDGLQVFEFPNKQVEHHFPDGTKQITFPDQTVKYLHTDGTEQTVFPDGTEMHIASNKDKTIVFANGQREIHTGSFKRREYPDGTSKTVFEDGRQETRYASGRLRVKDAHGNVIVDRMTT